MAHALGMRATSLAGSAGLLALLVAAALSVTYTAISPPDLASGPVVVIEPEPEPLPPPPQIQTQPPPPRAAQEPRDTADPVEPVTPQPPAPPDGAPTGPATQPYVAITNPTWVRQPRDLARYYPSRALSLGMEGSVVLDCMVGTDGRLSCAVVSETPENWRFGEAALRIAADYRMVPAMRDGVAVEGRYRMRVPFNIR